MSGIRDPRKAGCLLGMMRGVGGVRKSKHQSWLAKGWGSRLGLLCWGFKGVQEVIPSEEASVLQIGSVAFPPGQCSSPQLHPCHWLFGGALGLIVIVVGNGHCDSSSNLGRVSLNFHIALIHLGKVWIQLFSLKLWVNSRTD